MSLGLCHPEHALYCHHINDSLFHMTVSLYLRRQKAVLEFRQNEMEAYLQSLKFSTPSAASNASCKEFCALFFSHQMIYRETMMIVRNGVTEVAKKFSKPLKAKFKLKSRQKQSTLCFFTSECGTGKHGRES